MSEVSYELGPVTAALPISDGGLPFSPIGIVIDTYSSALFSSDREIAESVVDDALRRLVRSLPDARVYR